MQGSEIQFIVMEEPGGGGKGGGSRHRAVHISVLPKGTVKFEVTLHAGATGVVVKDPVFYPKEAPGLIRITTTVDETSSSVATSGGGAVDAYNGSRLVELWPRCMPEGLMLRIGDSILCDVVHYRPEKLIFARSIRVLSMRKLGRELGTVVKLQRRGGDGGGSSGQFGFIRPDNRDHDVFFRIPDVVGPNGLMLPDADVAVGLRLSFDVIAEDGARAGASGSGGRTRAIRACVDPFNSRSALLSDSAQGPEAATPIPPVAAQHVSAKMSGDARSRDVSDIAAAAATDSRCLLKSGVLGVIVRFPKKDQTAGVIQILSDISKLADKDFTDVLHKEIIDGLHEFIALDEWKEIVMEHVESRSRKLLHNLIQQKFPGVAHETVANPGDNTTQSSSAHEGSKTLKLWKLSADEFQRWDADRIKKEKSELTNRLFKLMTNTGGAVPIAPTELKNGILPVHENASLDHPFYAAFTAADIVPSKWSVDKDYTVNFDLCLEPSRSRLVASGIVVTDEAPEETGIFSNNVGDKWKYGRVEVVKHMKGGYLRCFPTDEKLRWEVPSVLALPTGETGKREAKFNLTAVWNNVAAQLVPDTLVAFQVRVRGGVRCAVGLHAVPVKNSGGELEGSAAVFKEIDGVAKPFQESFYAHVAKKTETLSGEIVAVVVENKHVVFLDVSACPLLVNKYHDINDPAFSQWLSKRRGVIEASTSGANAESWSRLEKKLETLAVAKGADENSAADSKPAANGNGGDSDDDEKEEKDDGGDNTAATLTYLPQMPNLPVPFYVEGKGTHYSVGDLVVCSAVANWALQRSPLHVNILRKFDRKTNIQKHDLTMGGAKRVSGGVVIPLGCELEFQNTAAPVLAPEQTMIRRCGTVRKILSANALFPRRLRQSKSAAIGSVVAEQWAEIVCDVGGIVAAADDADNVVPPANSNVTRVFLYDMRGLPKPIAPENLTGKEEKECAAAATATTAVLLNSPALLALSSISVGDLVDFIPVITEISNDGGNADSDQPQSNGGVDQHACGMAVAVNVLRASLLDKGKKLVAGKPSSVQVPSNLVGFNM